MITWFDAVLITLLAATTALGARRGLAGLAWGVGCVAVCFLSNVLFGGWPALPLAAVLGFAVAWFARRLSIQTEAWHLAAGAVGGFLLGAVLVAALALGLPVDPLSKQYPSASLPPAVYNAVSGSYLKTRLFGIFTSNDTVKTLFVPDYTVRR